VTRIALLALLVSPLPMAAAMGAANQANFNDGKQGSPMQCRTFEEDPQGTKCARFCDGLRNGDKTKQTYCMCLPGQCEERKR
jgi:hypothetical protein